MSDIRALILAAGSSQRLRPLTNEIPKTLLPLNGRTILSHIIGCCLRAGIKRISLVTGHGQERVQKECAQIQATHPACEFSFIHSPYYDSMGNVYSLYAARELFREPFVLINSDLVFSHEILRHLLASTNENAMVIDDCKPLGIEEMKVAVRDGIITSISKKLDPSSADGEYIGMMKINPSIAGVLETALQSVMQTAPEKYYEDAFQLLIAGGFIFRKVSTSGAPCMEIDTFEDLALGRASADLWL